MTVLMNICLMKLPTHPLVPSSTGCFLFLLLGNAKCPYLEGTGWSLAIQLLKRTCLAGGWYV